MNDVRVDTSPGMLQQKKPRCYMFVATRLVPLRNGTVHQRRLIGKAFKADSRTREIALHWPEHRMTLQEALDGAVPGTLPGGFRPMFGVAETGDIVQWGDPFCRGGCLDKSGKTVVAIVPLFVSDDTHANPALVEQGLALCGALHKALSPLRLGPDTWPRDAAKPLGDAVITEVDLTAYDSQVNSNQTFRRKGKNPRK